MSYKTAIGAPSPAASPDNSKYRAQARQLQELFPTWSNDDLQSLLQEVAGDVELAAARISEGHAEQWGAVTRKKDKKAHAPAHTSKDSVSSTRGDFRGGRGGARGGRGGSTRGGVASRSRGSVRGAAPVNGHTHTHHTSTAPAQSSSSNAWAERQPGTDKTSDSSVAWSSDPPIPAPPSNWSETVETPTPSATPSSWAGTSTTSTWVGDNDVNGSATSSPVVSPPKASKTPATSKMSWAQIARPQEKPASIPVPAAILSNITPSPPEPEPQQVGWEEPTTVSMPSWEEEAPVFKPSTSAADVWASTTINEPPEEPKADPQQIPEQQVAEEPVLEPAAQPVAPPPEPEVVSLAASPSPSIKPTGAARQATSSHRNSARYKNIDQAVVMPSSFSSGLEKVGMQFGSLSLGGESTLDNASEPEPVTEPKSASPTPAPVLHDTPPTATVPPTSASLGSALFQQGLPQQASPQPPSQHLITSSISQPVVSQTPKVALAEALASQSNPITPAMQQELNQLTSQQQQQYIQQHGGYIPPHLQQQLQLQQQQQQHQHLPQQSHTQHQYSQHGLPTHIDPSQPQATPQHQASSAHSSYFRNEPTPATSSPYFHAPTPPAGQTQDTPYGAFGQLGSQGQHQQGGHLSGFAQDYSHAADIQRGFYDTYQSSAFGNRNVLGHEDAKGLAGAPQQPPNAGGLPSSGQPVGQHGGAQGAGQQQPPPAAGPQGQQGYPPPLPYYYPYPQNQYYGGPYNSAYNVAPPFVKYPTMFPGPPGPGNGPATGQQSQGGLGVKSQGQAQGQAGAYGPAQGLYQGGYDDYASQTQGHGTHQQSQHALGLGQGGVDYGKQLYGGGAQGFMGLSGQGGGAGGPQAANARGGSPETAYKPYAKDVGVGAARGGAGQQGQGQGQQQQSQGQVQSGPQGQGFYGGNRFGGAGVGGVSAGGAGPQQSAHHQQGVPQGHLGYSQAQNDFYPYQGRQQQYW